jgi:FixJ family two-component response regulator
MSAKAVVYIVEDDLSFRKSLERLIRASGYEAISFDTAEVFLKQTSIRRPSCLLLDVRLPDMNGIDLQQKLIEKGSSLPVIFMTGHGSIPMGVQTIKNGAIDFLSKPFKFEDLRRAICEAIKRDASSKKIEHEASKIKLLLDTLTPREKEVLCWVITGRPNKQIAVALGTVEKTIRVHRGRVMHKMQCSSVAELVRLAAKVNLLPAA